MTFGDRFCFSRKGRIGGGGWVHQKGADMAVSGIHFGNASVGSEWAGHCCPSMNKQVEKTVLLPCTVPISSGEAFIPVWGGCGLSPKHVEDSRRRSY